MRRFFITNSALGLLFFLVVVLFSISACTKRIDVSQEKSATKSGTSASVQQPVPEVALKPVPTQEMPAAETQRPAETVASLEGAGKKASGQDDCAIRMGRTGAGFAPVYFDYDEYRIRPDMIQKLEDNAKWMKANANSKIRIEGNCDDRGSNEYNLALGERRANSAREYLTNLGVSPDRIEILSYGEEKPLLTEQDEESRCKNRRDDFVSL